VRREEGCKRFRRIRVADRGGKAEGSGVGGKKNRFSDKKKPQFKKRYTKVIHREMKKEGTPRNNNHGKREWAAVVIN